MVARRVSTDILLIFWFFYTTTAVIQQSRPTRGHLRVFENWKAKFTYRMVEPEPETELPDLLPQLPQQIVKSAYEFGKFINQDIDSPKALATKLSNASNS